MFRTYNLESTLEIPKHGTWFGHVKTSYYEAKKKKKKISEYKIGV